MIIFPHPNSIYRIGVSSDIEDRHVRGRVKDAFRSRTTEAREPGQQPKQDNFVSRHELKGAIHLLFRGRDPDGVELTELVRGRKLVKLCARRGDAYLPGRK
jgi:hypothetical protein